MYHWWRDRAISWVQNELDYEDEMPEPQEFRQRVDRRVPEERHQSERQRYLDGRGREPYSAVEIEEGDRVWGFPIPPAPGLELREDVADRSASPSPQNWGLDGAQTILQHRRSRAAGVDEHSSGSPSDSGDSIPDPDYSPTATSTRGHPCAQ